MKASIWTAKAPHPQSPEPMGYWPSAHSYTVFKLKDIAVSVLAALLIQYLQA